MATLAYALVELAVVKRRLGITGTADDTLLEELIDEMTVKIESYCDRRFFDDAAVTEIHDGDFDETLRDKLFTRRWPINSVTSVAYASGSLSAPTWNLLSAATDYIIDSDSGTLHLSLVGGRRTMRIIYRGGYTVIPHDLRHACIKEVSKAYLRRNSEGAKTESVGGASVGWNEDMDPTTIDILDRYRRLEF